MISIKFCVVAWAHEGNGATLSLCIEIRKDCNDNSSTITDMSKFPGHQQHKHRTVASNWRSERYRVVANNNAVYAYLVYILHAVNVIDYLAQMEELKQNGGQPKAIGLRL